MPFETFEEALTGWIVAEFRKDQGVDLSKDPLAMQRIREAVDRAKNDLSTMASTEINLPFITADRSGPKHLSMSVTRAQLEKLGIRR